MPLTDDVRGTNADGSVSDDYCVYCYRDGHFLQDFTMNQMVHHCLMFLDQMNAASGKSTTPEEAKAQMRQFFPHLKRWKEDNRTLDDKATTMLGQCTEVVLATVDAQGSPRPVVMSKLKTEGFTDIWLTTSADAVKVADLKGNPQAGICFGMLGDSVSMRGTAEVVTDDALRAAMWQDWFINHYPGGPADPNYVLIHFGAREATLWINGEFEHRNI